MAKVKGSGMKAHHILDNISPMQAVLFIGSDGTFLAYEDDVLPKCYEDCEVHYITACDDALVVMLGVEDIEEDITKEELDEWNAHVEELKGEADA